MADTDAPDCPLCMELFELDDLHFYPCSCGYQICRFCWHRIRTDGNGLCPACRKTYSEDPAMYRPLSQDELQKIKKERKQKEAQHKQKISDNRQHLSNIRVIQRHLVFVVGLSNKMADIEVLKRHEYFGKYGKIVKIVINPNTNYAGPQGPSASAYITYTKEEDALKAILSINNMQPPLKIRASLGTTKYCTHYLRNIQCGKTDCMYLHDIGDEAASFTKEDMQAGKHQLFEKNLLDQYVATHKKQKSQPNILLEEDEDEEESIEEEEEEEERTVPEDWGDEVDDDDTDIGSFPSSHTESLLPSQASWGTKDKHIENISASPSTNINGKTEQNRKTELKIVKSESPIHHVKEEEYPVISVANKITSPSIPIPNKVGGNMKKNNNENISPATSNSESLPEENLKASFSTGWATAADNVLEGDEANSNTESSNYVWPSVTDLGLSDLKISDDELGFDPFNESKNGLEDLIAREKQQGIKQTQPQPSFSWDAFWPSNYAHSRPQMLSNSYSLFGESQRLNSQHMMQYRPPMMNQFRPQGPPINPASNMNRMDTNGPLFRFPQQQPRFPAAPMPPPQFSQMQQQQQFQNQYMNQFRFQAPPSLSQISTTQSQQFQQPQTQSSTSSNNITDNKNWQDGLRALLPNINISFANQQLERTNEQTSTNNTDTSRFNKLIGANDRWNSLETVNQSQQAVPPQPTATTQQPQTTAPPPQQQATNPPQPQQKEKSLMASPPPGFGSVFTPTSVTTSKEEAPQTWVQGASRPPPPPGFGLPTDTFPSQTPGLLNISSLSAKTTQQTSNKKTANQRPPPEDPSILWSKILSDQNKDIETSSMSFPLPGESINQATPLDKIPTNHIPTSQPSSMTSWNTIVSGNQAKNVDNVPGNQKRQSPAVHQQQQQQPPQQQQPLTISAKESQTSSDPKPQKASPIFGSQQKHAIKKPTAHVKPLKNVQLDGFTTVQHFSRQSAQNQQHQQQSTGSRVSELDDFSADIVTRAATTGTASQNIINNLQDYPPVASNQARTTNATSGNKKKKKKGKDIIEPISEVIAHRVEVATEKHVEEERPKKAGKAKKKANNTKTSPLQVRKNSPPTQRADHNKVKEAPRQLQQQQQIRILKSDGNTGTTMHSPTQMMSEIEPPLPKLPREQSRDHEMVSRLTESTEKLLKNVLHETEAIKLNTEQISKDLKSALEKCKESSLSLSDLEKINSLLTPGKAESDLDNPDHVDTTVLERRVESARREAKLLEARLNDVIRKNMESELETLKRNTKGTPSQ